MVSSFATALALAGSLAFTLAAQPAAALERMVAPLNPAATDSGTGSPAAPYRTLRYAMSQLQPGDRLVIAGGTYRESLILPTRVWGTANTIIEGQGTVLIKASDEVTGWTALGNGRFVKPWPAETAQVFVDGAPLQQIAGTIFNGYPVKVDHSMNHILKSIGGIWPGRRAGDETTMPVGSFYYKHSTKSLYVRVAKTTLATSRVEVSARTYSLQGQNVSGITVRNIEFQHGNTSPNSQSGLLTMIGNRITLERIRVLRADSVGVEMMGDDNTIRDSSFNSCGQLGIKARGKRAMLINNETRYNNTRGFNKWWEAGGAKFVGLGGLQDSLVSGHRSLNNQGDGIWFDWKNNNNRIERSTVLYNSGMGIHYEASHGAVITNNFVAGNRQRGIYLPVSANSVVAFNLIASNNLQGIQIIDDGRNDPTGQMSFRPVNNRIFGNVIAWNAGALFLLTPATDNLSDSNVYMGSATQTLFAFGWPNPSQMNFTTWQTRMMRDLNSRSFSHTPDALFAQSLSLQRTAPDLTWYRNFRNASEPLNINPEWLRLVPDPPADLKPGPIL